MLLATDALAAFLMNALAQSRMLRKAGPPADLAWLDNLLQADELSAELNFGELVAQAREHKDYATTMWH